MEKGKVEAMILEVKALFALRERLIREKKLAKVEACDRRLKPLIDILNKEFPDN